MPTLTWQPFQPPLLYWQYRSCDCIEYKQEVVDGLEVTYARLLPGTVEADAFELNVAYFDSSVSASSLTWSSMGATSFEQAWSGSTAGGAELAPGESSLSDSSAWLGPRPSAPIIVRRSLRGGDTD